MKKSIYFKIISCLLFIFPLTTNAQDDLGGPGGDSNCNLTYSYLGSNITLANTISLSSNAQTIRIYLNFSSVVCREVMSYTNVPTWATITPTSFAYIDIAIPENIAPTDRTATIAYAIDGNGVGNNNQSYNGFIRINQVAGNGNYYYKDSDNDGFGDYNSVAELSLTAIAGKVTNNDDNCIKEYSLTNNGCLEPYENINWTRAQSYDINGNLIASSKSYFDDLGKPTQSQTYDINKKRTWATQILYDNQGRPAFQSMSAPITPQDASENFQYNAGFLKKTGGTNFTISDFLTGDVLSPKTIAPTTNTLGWYYSDVNTDEKYQDKTDRPYSRNIYSTLNPGAVKQTIGGNKINNEWKQGYSFSMPAAQEMYYVFGYNAFESSPAIKSQYTGVTSVLNDTNKQITWLKATKSIVQDVRGNESIVFTDSDGKTLGAARAGIPDLPGVEKQYEVVSLINEQGYVDIHIPQGCDNTLSFVGNTDPNNYDVYDLKKEELIQNKTNIPAGFYRIQWHVRDQSVEPQNPHLAKLPLTYINKTTKKIELVYPENIGVRYKVNYYDFSLNEYDKSGKLTASIQPIGFNKNALNGLEATIVHDATLKTTFTYNSLGQLTTTTSPDEGTANFKYRKDGQIRFSQNSKQLTAGEFSYTNYDSLGRPIESGVVIGVFSGLNADTSTASGNKEQHFTVYDQLSVNDKNSLATVHNDYSTPSFLAGNVAKTYNLDDNGVAISTSYYSYDVYGRVKWIIQNIAGLGYKTIDYMYDPITSQVNKVIFQKHNTAEYFEHKYTYDNASKALIKVETNTNNSGANYTTHADYSYYETGALKRTQLAADTQNPNGLQGIDYVYNLAGQLKAINHPKLNTESLRAQGEKAGEDLFGMTLDYYTGDYTRTTTGQNFSPLTGGTDQFNGNIKGMSWNTNAGNYVNGQTALQYSYTYNKNNWLTGADFNGGGTSQNTIPVDINLENTITSSQTKIASSSITLKPGFEFTATASTSFSALIDNTSNNSIYGPNDYKVYGITYDANGNIKKLNRNKNTENGNFRMDELTYTYKDGNKSNKLDYVADAVTITTNANDIKTQNPNNYIYNEIGQLTENVGEGVKYEYNTSGLVTKVKHNNVVRVAFVYNDKGFRTRKISYKTDGNIESTTDYIRDAAGSALAIYVNTIQKEIPIYGASRLGVYNKTASTSVYQLTDHLGNVRAVIAKDAVGNAAAMVSSTDYYPFGMPMPNRKTQFGEAYRYAYQGQEVDPETGKEAFQLRLWDARIGRWLTTDPKRQYFSPYMGMNNRPISSIDKDGGCADDKGNWIACPEDGTGKAALLDEVSLGSIKSKWRDYHPTINIDQLITMRNSVRGAGAEFFRHEVTMSVMALIAAPFAWEAMVFTAPYVTAEANLIGANHNVITSHLTKDIIGGFGVNSLRVASMKGTANVLGQFLSNGLDIRNVDYLDAGMSSVFTGNGSTLIQSLVDYKPVIGWEINSTENFVINLAGKTLTSELHSKIKIPESSWFKDAPIIDVANMFSKSLVSAGYKTVLNNSLK